mmetsp:Transcript_131694/g.185803  ORF Transcript_131694/g.185803 Transcript_131694/m.185803 type:complete len:230 (+) Transcript_131694:3-692(+)
MMIYKEGGTLSLNQICSLNCLPQNLSHPISLQKFSHQFDVLIPMIMQHTMSTIVKSMIIHTLISSLLQPSNGLVSTINVNGLVILAMQNQDRALNLSQGISSINGTIVLSTDIVQVQPSKTLKNRLALSPLISDFLSLSTLKLLSTIISELTLALNSSLSVLFSGSSIDINSNNILVSTLPSGHSFRRLAILIQIKERVALSTNCAMKDKLSHHVRLIDSQLLSNGTAH